MPRRAMPRRLGGGGESRSATTGKKPKSPPSPSVPPSSRSSSSASSHHSAPPPPEVTGTKRPQAHRQEAQESPERPSTATPSRSRSSPAHAPAHSSPSSTSSSRRHSLLDMRLREDYLESADKRFAYMRLSPHTKTGRGSLSAAGMNRYSFVDDTVTPRDLRTPSPPLSGRQGERRGSPARATTTLSPIRGRTAEEAMDNYLAQPHRHRPSRRSGSSHPQRDEERTASLSSGIAHNTSLVTVDPVEFSMEAYRELHQRHFTSPSEELSFLRRDFVSSRKTLAVLHDETVRLRAELQGRVDEVADLEEKVVWYRRQLDRLRGSAATLQNASYERAVYVSRAGTGGQSSETPDAEVVEGEMGGDARGEGEDAPRPSSLSMATTPIALFAAAGAASASHRRKARGKSEGVDNEINTVELINELRRNLAKRDTALDQCQLELADARRARDALERESRQAKLEASQARQEQQSTLTTLNEKTTALRHLEEAERQLRDSAAAKDEELAKLRKKCEIAELLRECPPAATGVDAGFTQHEHLFDQVKTYRERWQAAEDRVDELSRQLLSLRPQELAPPQPASPAAPSSAEVLRMETELRDQQETIRRLQRKMEREEESVAFREEQQRQQRQEDLRQHALEVAALREQLSAARNQLLNEAKDRESLTRQLRQATHTETMSETLQSQNNSLKQRLAEVAAELAQGRGREKELEISVQREMSERARLARENESLHAQLKESERSAGVLQDTLRDLRQRLGVAEARCFTMDQLVSHSPAEARSDTPASLYSGGSPSRGDGAAMASELKGYTALMRVNAELQEQLARKEDEIRRLSVAREEDGGKAQDSCSGNDDGSDDVGRQRVHLAVEVAELREELRQARRTRSALVSRWNKLQREHAEVLQDNILLANGAELLHHKLQDTLVAAAATPKQRRSGSRHQEQGSDSNDGIHRPSRLRRTLQRARRYAGDDEHGNSDAHKGEGKSDKAAYAGQLREALASARQQVAVLTSALHSLPGGTPLKSCSSDAAAPLRHCATDGAVDGIAVTITHESGDRPRISVNERGTPPPQQQPLLVGESVTKAELQAEAARVNAELDALRRALEQVTEERDHWRCLADRYTVVCTSTVDI